MSVEMPGIFHQAPGFYVKEVEARAVDMLGMHSTNWTETQDDAV